MQNRKFSFGGIGDVFGKQLGVFRAKLSHSKFTASMEEVAVELGADLGNPDDFEIVAKLAEERLNQAA